MTQELLEGLLRGVLGRRRKRSRNALRFLTGGRGHNPFINPSTLLSAAGLAWGIYETLQQRSSAPQPVAGAVPPLPPTSQGGSAVPPLPAAGALSPDVVRLVRLAISAAYADGDVGEKEHAAILQQVRSLDTSGTLERELSQPRPLSEIVSGVTDPAQRATLYVLAYTVLRADEQISNPERIYLAQLAHLLGLDQEVTGSLEKDTGERIDALGDQGQLGG